ncbi:Abi-alpha family protein [Mycolicibacterium sp. Dal123E01]|uniref:Abi-alpha family protein n=1 Tax=Mycolicibacterium sp. Dal123E01 TaxID=3457578 RepID=UPI00403E6503
MAFSYDPRGLIGHAVDAARRGLDVYSWAEEQVVGAIRQGFDSLDPGGALKGGAPEVVSEVSGPDPDSLAGKMSRLLDRALDQNTRGSQVELYHHLLDQLVADEARIVGALSDGSSSPMVNVYTWLSPRVPGRAALEHAALIGRTANVALPQMVPQYVSHLLSLGLVQVGPEDPALATEYEVLMAETTVLAAIKSASRGPLTAKVEKSTLTLSSLGASLWAATTGEIGQ